MIGGLFYLASGGRELGKINWLFLFGEKDQGEDFFFFLFFVEKESVFRLVFVGLFVKKITKEREGPESLPLPFLLWFP